MASTDHKSAAELEREVELQRSRVSSTIDELQTRLSPGQLVDQFMSYTKGGAGDFAQNLSKSVTANPLPVALMGASLLWLISGRSGGHGQHHATAHAAPYPGYGGQSDQHASHLDRGNGVADAARSGAHKVGDGISDAGRRVSGAADDLRSKADGAMHKAGDRLSDAKHSLEDGIDHARHAVGDGMSHARAQAGHLSDSLGHKADEFRGHFSDLQGEVNRLFRDQPLIAGALAFAAGAALGAAIPVTAKEDKVMGEASDHLRGEIKKSAEPLLKEGKAAVDHAVKEGKAAVEHAVEDGKAAARETGEQLSKSYDHLKKDLGDTAHEATDKAGASGQARPSGTAGSSAR